MKSLQAIELRKDLQTRTVYINDITAFLPNEPVENKAMESVLGQVGNRPSRARKLILRSNEIKRRYYAIDPSTGKATHNNAQLTAEAVRKLHGDSFDIEKIELLACGTTLPDQMLPNHALMVHGELGTPACEVVATAGICLSGVMALKYGYMSIMAGLSRNAVATGSENASAIMRAEYFEPEIEARVTELTAQPEIAFEKDFLRWMLSDGAGAIRMSDAPNSEGISLKIEWIDQTSYASELEACMYSGGDKSLDGSMKGWREFTPKEWLSESVFSVKQDVKLLNDKIVEYTIEKPLHKMVEIGQLLPDTIDYFLPHYSSGYFRERMFEGMKKVGCDIPQEKWFTNLASKGNTGSASIYIMLEELFHSGRLQKGEKILCFIPESGRFSTAFILLSVVS